MADISRWMDKAIATAPDLSIFQTGHTAGSTPELDACSNNVRVEPDAVNQEQMRVLHTCRLGEHVGYIA